MCKKSENKAKPLEYRRVEHMLNDVRAELQNNKYNDDYKNALTVLEVALDRIQKYL